MIEGLQAGHITVEFGAALYSRPWNIGDTNTYSIRLGDDELVTLLETRVGLSDSAATNANRIAQYRHRLDFVSANVSWFRNSFEADPWSTAAQMLRWRDELVLAGWDGSAPAACSERVSALAAVEAVDLPLDAGFGDRVRTVLAALRERPWVGIGSVEVVEPIELLAPVWREVLEALRGCDVSVVEREGPAGAVRPVVEAVFAEDEWEASEKVAALLAGSGDSTAVIVPGDGDVLDLALRERGLPETGVSESSRWRGALQALPLVIANAWRPYDIERLVEVLQLPVGPVPRWVSRHLLSALSREAGVGGAAWEKALSEIATERDRRIEGSAGNRLAGDAYAARLRRFLGGEVFDPSVGMPGAALVERCGWVIDSLAFRMEDDPVIAAAVGHARTFARLVEGYSPAVPRRAVERMLDSVIGEGVRAADRVEHAAPWTLLRHPGQLIDDVETTVWWRFDGSATDTGSWWSEGDRAALAATGCLLETPETRREREVWSWRNALARTRRRLVPVHVRRVAGEERVPHPFAHELGLEIPGEGRGATPGVDLPPAEVVAVEPGLFSPPERLSYTQVSTMLGCPMKWALQYHAGLSVSVAQSIPEGGRLIGILCHRIVEELYTPPGTTYTPEEAAVAARERFDALLPSMGAPFLREGMEVDRERARRDISRAVGDLVAAINRLGLTVESTEDFLKASVGDIPFVGYADLILRDAAGGAFVLDLKWSGSDTYHRDILEEGRALQLATYAWLLRARGETGAVQAGYFMLAQGSLITDSALAGDDRIDAARPLDQVWNLGAASWRRALDGLAAGTVPITGITHHHRRAAEGGSYEKALKTEADDAGVLYEQPPCRFCDFGHLCGITRLSTLT